MTKTKSTKRALLLSALSMLLCVSMLIGSTFAWFTDSVTSGNNIIKSGNLDVELEYWNGTTWADVKDASDILTNELWEPGVTEVAYLRVANAGSLAFKYQLGINILKEVEGTNQDGEKFRLSDYIMFGVVEGVNGETAAYAKNDAGRAAAIAAVTESKKISAGYTKASTMNPNDDLYLALVVYMPTDVGNVANHNGTDVPQIDLGINVYATQKDAESDAFGSDYDKDSSAFVSTAEELRNAIATVKDGGTIYVNDGTYNIDSQLTIAGKSVNIVGVGEDAVIHMTDTRTNYNKILYIYGSATEGEDVTVNISNVTLTADIATKSDIWIRTDTQNGSKVNGNVTVNLDNVTCTSIICDNNYVDGDTINLNITDSNVKKVALDASPFNGNGLNTYTNLTYNASRLDSITINPAVNDLTHIKINGVNPTAHGEQQPLTYVDTLEELQAALNNASDGDCIVLCVDITGNVTVTQKEGVNIVIDGKNYKYDGTIFVDGAARYTGAETLKIQNINFVTEKNGVDFISADVAKQYAHNVTIEKCTFTNKGEGTVVPARFRQAYNITMKDCTVEGTFSPIWATGGVGLMIDNVTANCTNEGIHVGTTDDVLVQNCSITVAGATGYGIRADATGAYTLTIEDCDIDAATAIVLRNAVDAYQATVDGVPVVGTSNGLQAAINSGATEIVLGAGEFTADLYVVPANRNLTITGQGAATKLAFSKDQVRLALFDSLTISNCTIEHMATKRWGHLVFGSSEVARGVYTISDCTFIGEGTQGIYINQEKEATFNIKNCTFNGDFGGEGAITIQDRDGVDVTVNVTDCEFNNIPATSHEICVFTGYSSLKVNADGIEIYVRDKQ